MILHRFWIAPNFTADRPKLKYAEVFDADGMSMVPRFFQDITKCQKNGVRVLLVDVEPVRQHLCVFLSVQFCRCFAITRLPLPAFHLFGTIKASTGKTE